MMQSIFNSLNNVFGPALPIFLFVVGVLLLLWGGHLLVKGAVTIAQRMGVPILLIGLTVVAAGTSSPELAFNIFAAWNGNGTMCFGNVVGSNIANIGLVLGISALAGPLTVHSRLLKRELPWLIGITILMLVLAGVGSKFEFRGNFDKGFTRWEGSLLLAFFGLILWFWFRQSRKDASDPLVREAEETAVAEAIGTLLGAWFAFMLGLACLLAGGYLAKEGAVDFARQLGISEAVIGLTIVAIATSLPEVITSWIACRKGYCDLAIGNVVGSNLFNIRLVLGVTSMGWEIPMPVQWGWFDLFAMLALTIILFPIALSHQKRITRTEGGMLLFAYVLYMTFSVLREYFPDWF